ncbi:hypothetical protein TVAG_073690 [Trichomonas vaginalis G3]|uniref:Uncharacterized protein n=1 Tax=Trichomonas vaginalis (strain ATCC PRA-98 / G3) TaxID=412133 RepID=A2EEA5_TRIV3|nr:protein ubiquitination [Trichomonas vaginalis G3]EAY09003.1 hypothetical protein TVAG_073690 [Trichomonas vaginalis G3]KAI5496288.1 protein ubiquitination [Trichomonas vaginalis G3]|eukprot:XP_001321226.1 hypothetical protein [Trichomonas vaginalis G3]
MSSSIEQLLASLHRGDQSEALLEKAAANIAELSKHNELYELPFGVFQKIIAKTSIMPVFTINKILTAALMSYKSLAYCLIPLINCGHIGQHQAMMALASLSDAPLLHEICTQQAAPPPPKPTSPSKDEVRRAPILKNSANVQEIAKRAEQKLSFIHYCEVGKVEIIKDLLSKNPGLINERNDYGDYPIHKAVWNDHPDVVKVLLDYKSDPNAMDNNKSTPLIKACARTSYSCAKMLLDAGADPDHISKLGSSALLIAVSKGATKIVKELLDHNANPDVMGKYQDTALHIAAQHGFTDIAQLLVDAGANVLLKNNRNQLAVDLASKQAIKDMLQE